MSDGFRPPIVPAGFFGIVLGLAGLGNAWRAAHQVWHLPSIVGEILLAFASIVWAGADCALRAALDLRARRVAQ
jgi:tellurite resistance protein